MFVLVATREKCVVLVATREKIVFLVVTREKSVFSRDARKECFCLVATREKCVSTWSKQGRAAFVSSSTYLVFNKGDGLDLWGLPADDFGWVYGRHHRSKVEVLKKKAHQSGRQQCSLP